MKKHNCGSLRKGNHGERVILQGWVDTVRVHGSVAFIDIRDRHGKTQLVFIKKNENFDFAKSVSVESCIRVEGEVVARKEGTENKDITSGEIEVLVDKFELLSVCDPLPFMINEPGVSEDLRMKYRYLDLRSDRMQKNLELRHKAIKFIRDYLDREKFLEITTPMLTKSTPEGARDFIVPSRIHPGKFYALPQSPQQYKQLLMVSGFDKYFQIAACFRDEDARADRSPGEFYQLDMEMSFINQNDILELVENMFIEMVRKVFPEKHFTQVPFPRLKYKDVMAKYGTDKPDLRKDKTDKNELAFAWVIDFPLFEEEMVDGHYAPMHHMFTMPKEDHWKYLTMEDAGKAESYQHDLVLNGFEVGGGSVRIHKPDIQQKIFDLIGFDAKDSKYFEHMLKAFKFGVPPHGGIAPGIDRLLMVILGEESIRELIAFPKNKAAQDPLMDAPADVSDKQLKEVHIKLDLKEDKNKI